MATEQRYGVFLITDNTFDIVHADSLQGCKRYLGTLVKKMELLEDKDFITFKTDIKIQEKHIARIIKLRIREINQLRVQTLENVVLDSTGQLVVGAELGTSLFDEQGEPIQDRDIIPGFGDDDEDDDFLNPMG